MIKLFKTEDYISILNAVFGLTAILMLFLEELRFSFIFIFLAVLADGLDGYIARRNGNKSQVGDFLESMADMMSMGSSPVFFTYYIFHDQIFDCFKCHFLMIAVLIFYFTCIVLRLSSFYVLKKHEYFIGLPAPAAALIVILLSYITINFYVILIVILLVSLFMISNFRFKKPCLKINIIAVVLIFMAILFNSSYNNLFLWLLFSAVLIYAVFSPVYQKVKK